MWRLLLISLATVRALPSPMASTDPLEPALRTLDSLDSDIRFLERRASTIESRTKTMELLEKKAAGRKAGEEAVAALNTFVRNLNMEVIPLFKAFSKLQPEQLEGFWPENYANGPLYDDGYGRPTWGAGEWAKPLMGPESFFGMYAGREVLGAVRAGYERIFGNDGDRGAMRVIANHMFLHMKALEHYCKQDNSCGDLPWARLREGQKEWFT